MPARQWLSLKAGDIVSTSIPLSSPVQLRVSGQLVAEGTLVSVDGKLGVELAKIVGT
jgi:flagellar motor switch/type III secretory pathway protein FliN